MNPTGNHSDAAEEWLPLEDLPRILKQNVAIPDAIPAKDALQDILILHLNRFFASERLVLEHTAVLTALEDVSFWGVETVLAKLRSLVEKSARRDVGEYCRSLTVLDRRAYTDAIHLAGIYAFRDNIETDLYVGLHTAISANFKMLGVMMSQNSITPLNFPDASRQLFRALRVIAVQPLRTLMAVDGLFWDSKLFTLPDAIVWRPSSESHSGAFFVNSSELERRLRKAIVDEKPTGCPALQARSKLGIRAIDVVQARCLSVAHTYFIDAHFSRQAILS